ncbi:hypothetical protein NEOLEDRAFT_1109068 [Neolentinus lepideus HHB14362 ss-1]|uniref:Mid2 domain-containing protein n=1 Tax=Neolentinus lepideus HHB14362 ss-1 TaxID=1314782 RepID=A0A165UIZ1_9AGAM|nr:hypothetical protein NEOLEDRAFT_1109068 [Neolentinus lepideus HHB14362 ss-1]
MIYHLLLWTFFFGLWWSYASGFSVQYGQPLQCDDFQVSWSGGQAPFNLLLVPSYGTPRNMSIPSSSFSGSSGSYSTQLPFAENSQMMAVMYDATGIPSGAVSQIMTVGQSTSGQSCNTTDVHPDFFYEWPEDSPTQCSTYEFYDYPNATLPVTLTILVPGQGAEFVQPSASATNFTWTVNMAAGTFVMFVMTDAQGHQGGASNPELIQPSNDFGCVVSVGSSTSSSSVTSAATSSPSPTGTDNHSDNRRYKISVGTIAGIAAGGAVCALLAAVVAFFLWRRCRRTRGIKGRMAIIDLKEQPMESMGFHTPQEYSRISPFTALATSDHTSSDFDPYALSNISTLPKTREYPPSHTPQGSSATTLQSYSRPGGSSNSNPSSTRVVVHQDYADVLPPEEEVVELPPEYRDDRRPIPGLQPPQSTRPAGKRR